MSVLSSVQILKTKSQRSKLGNVKLQSSKYKESVKTVKISIINTQLTLNRVMFVLLMFVLCQRQQHVKKQSTLNRVMYTTYIRIMSITAKC